MGEALISELKLSSLFSEHPPKKKKKNVLSISGLSTNPKESQLKTRHD